MMPSTKLSLLLGKRTGVIGIDFLKKETAIIYLMMTVSYLRDDVLSSQTNIKQDIGCLPAQALDFLTNPVFVIRLLCSTLFRFPFDIFVVSRFGCTWCCF